jgi:hypothetical protein
MRRACREANIAAPAESATTFHDEYVQPLGWHTSPLAISVTAMSVTVTIQKMTAAIARVSVINEHRLEGSTQARRPSGSQHEAAVHALHFIRGAVTAFASK